MQTDAPTETSVSVIPVIRSAWGDFYRSRFSLIVYSVAVKLAEAWLVLPVIALGLTLLLRMSGHVAVSNWDAYQFLMSPAGMIYIGFLGAVTVTLILFEQAGIMSLAQLGDQASRKTLRQLVAASFPQPWRVGELGLILLAVIALGFIPLSLLLRLIHRTFLSQHDINYYVTVMPPNFWIAAGLGSVVVLAATIVVILLSVRWSLALPIVLFERQPPLTALRASHDRVRGHAIRVGSILVGWLLIVLGLGFVMEAALGFVARTVLDRAGEQPVLQIVLLLFLQTCLVAALTFLSNAGFSLITRRLYLLSEPQSDLKNESDPLVFAPQSKLSIGGWTAVAGFTLLIGMVPLSIWANLSRLGSAREPVKVTAHRGHSHAAPENTLSAVRKAIESGADFAEIDVLLTADGVPILLHDSDLKRTAGDPRRISDVTFDQVRTLDVGNWFSPEFAGETIPTLREVLELAKGRIKLNVELKIYDDDPRLVPAMVQQITDYGFESDCIVTTFKYEALLEVKRLNPRLQTGQIVAHALGDVSQLEVDALSVRANWLTDPVLREAHRQEMQVHVWTVNEAAEMYRLIKRGVDNIITDDPDLLIQVRNKWQSLTPTERLIIASRLLLGLEP